MTPGGVWSATWRLPHGRCVQAARRSRARGIAHEPEQVMGGPVRTLS